MRNPIVFSVLLSTLLCGSAMAENDKAPLSALDWLKGCWGSTNRGREVSEQWMKPAGQTMLGMSRTIANGKTVAYEFLQIRQDASGDLFYVAKPSGQTEASFKLVKFTRNEFVFENPDHDFPQRIIYRLETDGSLSARIEGKNKGEEKSVDFPMKRIPCD